MTFAVYQYNGVTPLGVPIEPPAVRTIQAFGEALTLEVETSFVIVVPNADMALRVSNNGAAATVDDQSLLAADPPVGFPVTRSSGTQLYGIAI